MPNPNKFSLFTLICNCLFYSTFLYSYIFKYISYQVMLSLFFQGAYCYIKVKYKKIFYIYIYVIKNENLT